MEVDGKWRRQRDFNAHSANHPMMLWLPIPVNTPPPPLPSQLLLCAEAAPLHGLQQGVWGRGDEECAADLIAPAAVPMMIK
jgi:hypothetical protein